MLLKSNPSKIQDSIGTVQSCHLATNLVDLLVEFKKEKKCCKTKDGKMMIKNIEELAENYWSLEMETMTVVKDIQAYGENLQRAAKCFEQEGNTSFFFKEITDLSTINESLMKANNKHQMIKGKMEHVKKTAKIDAETFAAAKERAHNMSEYHFVALMTRYQFHQHSMCSFCAK